MMNTIAVSLRKKLSDFICKTTFSSIPDKVLQHAKRCILDLVGVSIAGAGQTTAAVIKGLVPALEGKAEVTLWSTDRQIPLLSAVLLNTAQSHVIDMDDGHRYANGHPGAVTIPAAVALAERDRLTGKELLEAIVIGYDIFIRLGTAVNPELLMRGFHTTATIGPFASAAVASKMMGLSPLQTENALALAGLQSAGLLEALTSGETGKSFQVGKAAQSGVMAALLARQGAYGPDLIFEGDKGLFRAFAGKPCDSDAVCLNLGADFAITDVYFKKHAACRHIHSALDATAEIIARYRLTSRDVASIEVETYTIAQNLTGHLATQESEIAAKFSMPIAIALLLVFGQTDSAAFKKHFISDPLVQETAKKITVKVNADRDKAYPKERSALVTITTKRDVYRYEVTYPKGENENPLTENEFIDKYEKNALTLYSKDRVNRIRDMILDIENQDIRQLAAMLKVLPPSGYRTIPQI